MIGLRIIAEVGVIAIILIALVWGLKKILTPYEKDHIDLKEDETIDP